MTSFRSVRLGAKADSQSRKISAQLGLRRNTELRQLGVEALIPEGGEFSETRYIPITGVSPIKIEVNELVNGMTILGVRTTGAVTIRLPVEANERMRIIVKDERDTAATDNITVEIA